jgi:hypothetical protein
MLVMMAVMRRPPEGALLRRRTAQKRQEKLKGPTGLVTAVGEIAMESPRDPKLASKKHESAQHRGLPVDPRPKYRETRKVNKDEKNAGERDTKASMHKC